MKVYFERKLLGGFSLALDILANLGIYSYGNSGDSTATALLVCYTNEVTYQIEKSHSSHLEIEAQLTFYGRKIWSENKLHQGATSYFFIPTLNLNK